MLTRLSTLPTDIQQQVTAAQNLALSGKVTRKRTLHAERVSTYRSSKRQRTDPTEVPDAPVEDGRDIKQFLDLPTEEELMQCFRNFLCATSNDALRHGVCASCARQLMETELIRVDYLSLTNRHLLQPSTAHPFHGLKATMLLVTEHLDDSNGHLLGWICKHCLAALKKNRRPNLSLANNMWIGPTPDALKDLTLCEQLLISLQYPRGYVLKLYSLGAHGSDHPGAAQPKLKGNITTYFANIDAVKQMLEGQLMPRKTCILPSLVAVTFIGRSFPQRSHLRKLFRVRRQVVYNALLALKFQSQHSGYAELEIDQDSVLSLPEDEVPEEILATVRLEDDEGVVEEESSGYVPKDTSESSSFIPSDLKDMLLNEGEEEFDESVSFAEHARWCLQYYDGRFRKNITFIFWVLSLQQKRQALNAAKLTMNRNIFERFSAIVQSMKEEDFQKAADEEKRGTMCSDPKIRLIQKVTHGSLQHVMGSDASRSLNRSKIWSTSLCLNPVNLWITLNPADRHDPICQIFAGKEINMDDLTSAVGCTPLERAETVAQDPFAATQFFFFLANVILETLFGFNVSGRKAGNTMGALGLGNAYFGAVEAQGRGSLHLHLLMWLQNSPNTEEIHIKLKSPEFREKIKTYLHANIRSHLDGLTEEVIETMEASSELAWSRPPHPDSPTFRQEWRLLELKIARSQQYHKCMPRTCQVYNKRKERVVCKRRAPFELSSEDKVTESGIICTKRLVARLNNWCPVIFYGGRCNNDIKMVTNGDEARAIAWYLTWYSTKKQGISFNQSAVLARTFEYHRRNTDIAKTAQENNRLFLFRCSMSLNREMEFSGQQACAYIMGHGDVIKSHNYTPIFLSSIVSTLKRFFPELKSIGQEAAHANASDSNTGGDDAHLGLSSSGTPYLKSQIDDYRYRGEAFESMYLIELFVETYEERLARSQPKPTNAEAEVVEAGPSNTQRAGRPRNLRATYQDEHPRADIAQRVQRSKGHRTLPDILGPWFERNDDPETHSLYCASVLACLKPWRSLRDLKSESEDWTTALEHFLANATDLQRCIAANTQYYYQCRDRADADADADADAKEDNMQSSNLDQEPSSITTQEDIADLVNGIELEQAVITGRKQKEITHAERAVAIGNHAGLFGDGNNKQQLQADKPAVSSSEDDLTNAQEWIAELKQAGVTERSDDVENLAHEVEDQGGVGNMESTQIDDQPTVTYLGDNPSNLEAKVDVSKLSADQLRAFKIVEEHFTSYNAGKSPGQLLMMIQGEGGTGKSLVISKITELFESCGKGHYLRKSAYTGIAASLIGGSTLHQLVHLHQVTKTPRKTVTKLQQTWRPVEYLVIDESSMISKKTLAEVAQMISIGKQRADENNSTVPFAGVNVILAGDFHQFPPVIGAGKSRGALYAPSPASHGLKYVTGRELYEQFNVVVILKEQFRIRDKIWQGILSRARTGSCTASDLKTIRGLVLDPTQDRSLITSKSPEWADAILVTPRHAVRNLWNESAARYHCQRTGRILVESPAYDTENSQPLDRLTRAVVRARMFPSNDGGSAKGDPGGLPDIVQLAVGMKVMVTYNIETELAVANGAKGIVERIIADEEDLGRTSDNVQTLSRPPVCVLVRLERVNLKPLSKLDPNVVPITPIQQRFKVQMPGGKVKTLNREQLPLTPAYAFTDYRAQGQTLPYVIVDLATPPSGGLTPFNAYVALSRSRAREQIRLLRDFDDKLFTVPPSEELMCEDERLERLNELTKQTYEARQHLPHELDG